MIWFFERPNRLVAERRAVTALASSVDWLDDFGFGIGDGARLVLHFTVAVGDAKVDLELRYPRLYPDTCPDVVPRDTNLRLSDHQWSGGSLCLEYRTDNWRPELTAADMIRSAQALLSAEATTEGGAARLPSAHELTQGQRLRAADYRHVYSDALVDLLRQAAPGTRMAATMRFQFQGSAVVARIDAVDTPDGRWLQPGFPQDGHQATGVVMLQPEPVTADTELDLTNAELPREWARLCANTDANPETAEFALVLGGSGLRMAWRWLQTHAHLTPVVPVHAGDGGSERIGSIQSDMAAKAVAVVGCGSAGSKVAASLARSGIGRFVLVDDDVLLRGNLVRNDLDWRAVGAHKVHAVAARLRLINPEVTVSARALRLGGQEASGSVDTALEALSQCDLIVDATADANAFNIVSAVARRAGRPMVWLEVFEGDRWNGRPIPTRPRRAAPGHAQRLPRLVRIAQCALVGYRSGGLCHRSGRRKGPRRRRCRGRRHRQPCCPLRHRRLDRWQRLPAPDLHRRAEGWLDLHGSFRGLSARCSCTGSRWSGGSVGRGPGRGR